MNQQTTPSVSLKTSPLLAQWLRFEADGSVTVFTGKAELGQGILHALKLTAAHELDLPLTRIRIETANTAHSPDEGMTSGSLSVQDSGMAIRQACAHAAQLFKMHTCTAYAELRSKIDAQLPVDVTVPTKSTALNLTEGREDLVALVHGKPIFLHDLGINVDLTPIKNLLHGRMVRGPGLRCTLRDEGWTDALAAMSEEIQVFRDGSLVGVVAPTALHHGSMGPSVALAVWESSEASSGLKVWSHTQGIFPLRKDLALAFGVNADQIEVQHVRGAGCYGHNGADDVAYDAAWLARHVPGQCVRVQWTREEEMQQSPLAPAMRVKLQAKVVASAERTSKHVDKDAGPIEFLSWQHDVWSQGHSARPGRAATPAFKDSWQTAQKFPALEPINVAAAAGAGAERNAIPPYRSQHVKVNAHRLLGLP
ncbi:MAG: hypothetical protein EBS88_13140, partial [Betaproteobacteria bacterium]|nr:hypothetical protein [Betaproteobacteria bacterium]